MPIRLNSMYVAWIRKVTMRWLESKPPLSLTSAAVYHQQLQIMLPYTYKPIDLATDAIRLVRLFKGDTDVIRCEIFETFLHQIGRDRILWIDALCIDQKNPKEQGHQVGQMRYVYKYAEHVIIWLGWSTAETSLLMDMMNKLDKRAVRHKTRGSNLVHLWTEQWKTLLDDMGGHDTCSYRLRCAGLRDLLQRPWFSRIWVIQEIASARTAIVTCGWDSIPTRTFSLMPGLMTVRADRHAQAILDVMPGHGRKDSWWSNDRSLHNLLNKFKTCDASRAHDMIYALLGISSDANDSRVFPPDYELSMGALIPRVISYLLFGEVLDPSIYKFPSWSLTTVINSLDDLRPRVVKWAVEKGDIPITKKLFEYGSFDVNSYIEFGWPGITPLLFSLRYGTRELCRAILASDDIDVHVMDIGDTALTLAARKGYEEIVALLMDKIAIDKAANFTSCADQTLLEIAGAHRELLKNQLPQITKALRIAAEGGHEKVVRLLLSHNVELEGVDDVYGRTALWLAASKGHSRIVGVDTDRRASV
ncbi:ankyrin [Thozetella sp. PMI_491]|nr:ankyrin [Thozetella sp. PMI_491]